MKYFYDRVLKKNEILVCLIDKRKTYPELSNEILEASKQYNFTYCHNYKDLDQINLNQFLLKHIIIFDGLDDPKETTSKYKDELEMFTSATLAVSYSSEKNFNSASIVVEELKKSFNKINFLRPTKLGDQFIPTIEKLVDNSICDSVRIKYQAKCRSNNTGSLISKHIEDFFHKSSHLIRKHNLFHRSSTDGFISLRCPEGGFFITATKTDKITLDLNRIVHVHDYNNKSNILEYSGNYLPSSDSVEASVIYSKMPSVNAILHTHASQKFTRNPKFNEKIAVPPMRYGEKELGNSLVDYFQSKKIHDMAIMEDHGELFLSKEIAPNNCINAIKNTIESNLF